MIRAGRWCYSPCFDTGTMERELIGAWQDVKSEHITTSAEFDALEGEWRRLFDLNSAHSSPLQWVWMREWWRRFGEKAAGRRGGLWITVLSLYGRAIAILPLYRVRHSLCGAEVIRFISSGGEQQSDVYPEYMDFLHDPRFSDLLACLLSADESRFIPSGCAHLLSGIVRETSLVSRWMRGGAATFGVSFPRFSASALYADLFGGFEQYLGRLSAPSRQRYRKLMRLATADGVRFEVARTAEEGSAFLEELILLHQERWKDRNKVGAFSSREVITFHRRVVEELVPVGRLLLTRIMSDNRPEAVLYGFPIGDRFEFYQSGVTMRTSNLKSPGILAHLLTMRYLTERGVTKYDFLSGPSEYKRRLATGELHLHEFSLVRHGRAACMSELRRRGRAFLSHVKRLVVAKHEPAAA